MVKLGCPSFRQPLGGPRAATIAQPGCSGATVAGAPAPPFQRPQSPRVEIMYVAPVIVYVCVYIHTYIYIYI